MEQNLDDNFCAEFLPEEAPLQKGAKRQVMPPKLNYKWTIKIPMPKNFSRAPTVEQEAEDHWCASDNEDKELNKEEELGTTETPTISSVTEAKRSSPFATWRLFIPSNSQSNFLRNLHTQPYLQLSSVQPFFSPEQSSKAETPRQHCMTHWYPQISSVDYSQPKETKKWKQPYSPAYLVRTVHQWQNAPYQKWGPCSNKRRSFINNWSKHWPKSNKTSRKITN